MQTTKPKLTHKELVISAYRWARKNSSCGVVLRELYCGSISEIPDVIGFGSHGHSVLIECKSSRSDFLADRKKFMRQNPELGMGKYRLFCCPEGMIKENELPEKWGLIYVNEKGKATCIKNPLRSKYNFDLEDVEKYDAFTERNVKAEANVMYSALRRLSIRGLIETIYQKP